MAAMHRQPHPGDLLRAKLDERGWSQGDLADILDTTAGTVNRIACHRRGISHAMARKLAAAFGDSPAAWHLAHDAYELARAEDRARRAEED